MSKTIVLQNSVATDVDSIVFQVKPGGTTLSETVNYQIRDANGNKVKAGKIALTPAGATLTTLLAHITSTILPAIDTAEGT